MSIPLSPCDHDACPPTRCLRSEPEPLSLGDQAAVWLATLDQLSTGEVNVSQEVLSELREGLSKFLKEMLARTQPARLVMTLRDPEFPDSVALMVGTTQVTMVVVDHRAQAAKKVYAVSCEQAAEMSAVLETALDEAAEYVQLNPEITGIITSNCSYE